MSSGSSKETVGSVGADTVSLSGSSKETAESKDAPEANGALLLQASAPKQDASKTSQAEAVPLLSYAELENIVIADSEIQI